MQLRIKHLSFTFKYQALDKLINIHQIISYFADKSSLKRAFFGGKKKKTYTANEQVTTMNYLKATICNDDLENQETVNIQHSKFNPVPSAGSI